MALLLASATAISSLFKPAIYFLALMYLCIRGGFNAGRACVTMSTE